MCSALLSGAPNRGRVSTPDAIPACAISEGMSVEPELSYYEREGMGISTILDRQLQRTILTTLAECYPAEVDIDTEFPKWHEDPSVTFANVHYLWEHQLVNLTIKTYYDGERSIQALSIAHKGMDFLLDDGGLSAILNVVTVKLHPETLQALLASKVESSDLPAEQKQSLLSQIRELRGEAAKHLVTKIIDYGLDQGPSAIHWLTTAIKSL